MVKLKTEETPLQTAEREQAYFVEQLQRAQKELTDLFDIEARRLDPNTPTLVADQKNAISLRSEITDWKDALNSLLIRIGESDKMVVTLKQEEQRIKAADAHMTASQEFADLIQTFATDDLAAWLLEAEQAHHLYFSANHSSDMKFELKREGAQELLAIIKRLQAL